MTDKTIHTINAATWTKYGRWRVELQILDEPMKVCWLSDTQYDFLRSAFEHTRTGYSGHGVAVVATFNEKSYYERCKAMKVSGRPRHRTPLLDPDQGVASADLLDHD